jgi:hypothetical protein
LARSSSGARLIYYLKFITISGELVDMQVARACAALKKLRKIFCLSHRHTNSSLDK